MRKSLILPLSGLLALWTGLGALRGAVAHARPTAEPVQIARRSVPMGVGRVPRIRLGAGTSSNWSGYAVDGSNVTDVKGSWKVPSVNPGSCPNGYSAAWVGIDGDNSNTVEQCGTEQDSSGQYYAWYEMYPKGFVRVGNVSPGASITAEVQYQPSSRTFLLTLTGGGATLNTQQKLPQAQRTSAEWIMEAPWSGGVLPLADFGSISYSGCQATVNGVTGALGSWSYDSITMVGSNGPKAIPSTVSGNSGFSISWKACQ